MATNGKLFGVSVMVLALVLATGTDAFSTVTADRNVDIVTESDGPNSALVKMAPHTGPNGAYAGYDANGQLTVDIEAVNPDGVTHVNHVFNITNKAEENMTVWITDLQPKVTFHTHDGGIGSMESKGKVVLAPGQTVQVSIDIDATGDPAGLLILDTVTVHAESTDASSTVTVHASGGITI